jgi:hypothetical protein
MFNADKRLALTLLLVFTSWCAAPGTGAGAIG